MDVGRTSARPRVIYLAGSGRSGSTLLERILGALPGWTNVGELVDLAGSVLPDDELCGCGEPFSRCPLWTAVGEQAFGGWAEAPLAAFESLRGEVARQRHIPALLALSRGGASKLAHRVGEYQHAYGRIYRAVADLAQAHTIVDASKNPGHGLALGVRTGDDPGYDLVVVNIVRDPRGVAYSWSRRVSERPQAGAASSEQRAQMWSPSVARSGGQWAAMQAELTAIGRFSGLQVVRVRYEDLVAEPKRTITRLLAELGHEPGPHDLDHVASHAVTLVPSHGLSGNPGRFRNGAMELSTDVEWHRAMPTKDRRLVTATTLPWLLAYGYSLRVGGPPGEAAP